MQPLKDNPDGMSGGPAFVIQLERGRPRAYFAGIDVDCDGCDNVLPLLAAQTIIRYWCSNLMVKVGNADFSVIRNRCANDSFGELGVATDNIHLFELSGLW